MNDTSPHHISTLSLHDALPISIDAGLQVDQFASRLSFFWNAHNNLFQEVAKFRAARRMWARDRKSTRLNSSHVEISYAVFCLKKKNSAEARRIRGAEFLERRLH